MDRINYITAVKNFCQLHAERRRLHFHKQYGHPADAPLEEIRVDEGQKYDRIVSHGSAFCFIDRNNGNILKASSWNAPEKKHPRGNIFNENPLQGTTLYGTVYLK